MDRRTGLGGPTPWPRAWWRCTRCWPSTARRSCRSSILPTMPAEAARNCRSDGTYPVLIGRDDVVLSSPIILYDHPEVAEQSPGDLFDAPEIDEILALRVMTLTDAEKAEARGTDARAAAIIDRCDTLSPEAMGRLHGQMRPVEPEWPTADHARDGRARRGGTRPPTRPWTRGRTRWRWKASSWRRGPRSGSTLADRRTRRTCSSTAAAPRWPACSRTSTAESTWPSRSTTTRAAASWSGRAATSTSTPKRSSRCRAGEHGGAGVSEPHPRRGHRQRLPLRRRLRRRGGAPALPAGAARRGAGRGLRDPGHPPRLRAARGLRRAGAGRRRPHGRASGNPGGDRARPSDRALVLIAGDRRARPSRGRRPHDEPRHRSRHAGPARRLGRAHRHRRLPARRPREGMGLSAAVEAAVAPRVDLCLEVVAEIAQPAEGGTHR